jgi:hypothetical protein
VRDETRHDAGAGRAELTPDLPRCSQRAASATFARPAVVLFRIATLAWLAIACTCPSVASSHAAAVPGWPEVRWGMTTADLDSVLGAEVRPAPGRLDYGSLYAERVVPGVEIGEARFTAMFQMDKADGRLRQILLQMRRPLVSPRAYDGVLAALRDRYGAPADSCFRLGPGRTPETADVAWRLPEAIVRAVFLDFRTTAIFSEDPNVDIDPLVPYYKIQRNNRRFLPRRILVRLTDAADPALAALCGAAR